MKISRTIKGAEKMTRKQLLNLICDIHPCVDFNLFFNKWLDEYDKHVIEQYKADTNLKDTIREIHDNVAREMYCKGIDDVVIKIKECVGMDWEWDYMFIEQIAEELKAGGKNE